MDIDGIKILRDEFREILLGMVQEFEASTDTRIEHIAITRVNEIGTPPPGDAFSITLENSIP